MTRCCSAESRSTNPTTAMLVRVEPSEVGPRPPLWREVHISGNPAIGDEGVAALAKALPPTTESLWLSRTSCGDVGFCSLVNALKSTRIQQLGFDINAVGDQGWQHLARELERDGACVCVRMSCGGRVVRACRRAAAHTPTGSIRLTQMACVAIVRAELPHLAYVSGDDNLMGDVGMRAMAEAFDAIAERQEEFSANASAEIVSFLRGLVQLGVRSAEQIADRVLEGELDRREGVGTAAALLDRICSPQHWSLRPQQQDLHLLATPQRRQILVDLAAEALKMGGIDLRGQAWPPGQRRAAWQAKGSRLFWLSAVRNKCPVPNAKPSQTDAARKLRGRGQMSWGVAKGDEPGRGGLVLQMQGARVRIAAHLLS